MKCAHHLALPVITFVMLGAACSNAADEAHEQSTGQGAEGATGSSAGGEEAPPEEHGSGSFEARIHEPSPPEEAERNRERCELGEPAGCHAAALDAYYSPAGPETDARALQYFTRGCDGGYAPSCNGLGVLHAQGRGVPQDDAEAARLYRRACADGASTACQHLAQAYRRGRGVPRDDLIADRLDRRADCVFQASLGHGDDAACPPVGSVP